MATGIDTYLYAAASGVLGFVISFTYLKTGRVSVNFARSLVILPVLVCVVMQAVNGNLGTSVAILGAFSLIRFRSLQGSSRDIAFIFFTMTVGILCSVGELLYGAGVTAAISAVLFFMKWVDYGQKKVKPKDLRITIPENLDYTDIFEDIFKEYLTKWELVSVKTTNLGSLYELQYRIEQKDQQREKEMLDEIRIRNGNLNIVCGRYELAYEEL